MMVRFEMLKVQTNAQAEKLVKYALSNGWTPESFARQVEKRPKLFGKGARMKQGPKLVLKAAARLSRGR